MTKWLRNGPPVALGVALGLLLGGVIWALPQAGAQGGGNQGGPFAQIAALEARLDAAEARADKEIWDLWVEVEELKLHLLACCPDKACDIDPESLACFCLENPFDSQCKSYVLP